MNPTYDFRDRVAVVTGAGSGTGACHGAEAFAESGAAVVLADRNEQTAATARADLLRAVRRSASPAKPTRRHSRRTCRSQRGELRRARLRVQQRADIQAPPTDAADGAAEIFTVWTPSTCAGSVPPRNTSCGQCARKEAVLPSLTVPRSAAWVGIPGRAAYHASKHGVIGLTHKSAGPVRALRPHGRARPGNHPELRWSRT